MSGRAFWPGFSWRILAHRRTAANSRGGYTGERIDVRSDPQQPAIFDELVIDDWLHLEQMSDRLWWMGLGHADDGVGYEYMIHVSVDRDGRATVSIARDA